MTIKESENMQGDGFSLVRWFRTLPGVCLVLAAAVAGAYLTFAHTVHVLGVLPYLLILLCPLLHLFMMRGMHGQGGHSHAGQATAGSSSDEGNTACH